MEYMIKKEGALMEYESPIARKKRMMHNPLLLSKIKQLQIKLYEWTELYYSQYDILYLDSIGQELIMRQIKDLQKILKYYENVAYFYHSQICKECKDCSEGQLIRIKRQKGL